MRLETIDKHILSIALAIIALLIGSILLTKDAGTSFLAKVLEIITFNFGSVYLWACLIIFFLLLYLAFSKYGKIRLGTEALNFLHSTGSHSFSQPELVQELCTGGLSNGRTTSQILRSEWNREASKRQVSHRRTACSTGVFLRGRFTVSLRFRFLTRCTYETISRSA